MARAVRNYVPQNLFPQQRQITNEVQHLVPHKLIIKSQRRILHAISGKHDTVLSRCPADQSHIAHLLLILSRAEGASRRDLAKVISVSQLHAEGFLADKPMRKINGVRDRIGFRRIHRNKFVAFVEFQRMANAKIGSRTPLLSNSRLLNQFHERPSAAIQDRQFKVIQFDDGIINASSDESRKQMLGGGNEHAFLHQTGGVADAGHVAADSLNREAVEVNPMEYDASTRRRRQDSQMDRSAAVQADSGALHCPTNCLFVSQPMESLSIV